MATTTGSPALEGIATAKEAASGPAADSPKRQGDKLGVAAASAAETASAEPRAGDSPKPHGDKLQHSVDVASGRD